MWANSSSAAGSGCRDPTAADDRAWAAFLWLSMFAHSFHHNTRHEGPAVAAKWAGTGFLSGIR